MHWSFVNCISEEEIIKEWDKEKPLVTIVCVTYNHGLYIKDAINGFLAQKSSYPFEIVIYDDASTDNAQQIINIYYSHYPNLINPILQKENQWLGKGINGTIKFAYPAAKGKYIALCEGDDYWTDPYKLQKQVDFLELNENYSMCFHNATESLNGLMSTTTYTKEIKSEVTIEDFIGPHIVATASIVFRSKIKFLELSNQISSCDKLLIFLCVFSGRIHYINEIMSHYRVHDQGLSRSEHAKGMNKIFDMSKLYVELNKYTNGQYEKYFKKGLEYEIGVHILDAYRKDLKTKKLIKEIFIRIGIKFFNYKRKS